MNAKGQWPACMLHFCSLFILLWRKKPTPNPKNSKTYYFCSEFMHWNRFCC